MVTGILSLMNKLPLMRIITQDGCTISDGSDVLLLVRGRSGDELSECRKEVSDGGDGLVLFVEYFLLRDISQARTLG